MPKANWLSSPTASAQGRARSSMVFPEEGQTVRYYTYDRSRDTPTLIHDHSKIHRAVPRRSTGAMMPRKWRRNQNTSVVIAGTWRCALTGVFNRVCERVRERPYERGTMYATRCAENRSSAHRTHEQRHEEAHNRCYGREKATRASRHRDELIEVLTSLTAITDPRRMEYTIHTPAPQSAIARHSANPLPRFDTDHTDDSCLRLRIRPTDSACVVTRAVW